MANAKKDSAPSANQIAETSSAHPVSATLIGIVIGFIAASVLYSPYMPPWVPGILAKSPAVFYGLFILITGIAGYIWGTTGSPVDDRSRKDQQTQKIPINTIITFMFIGFLLSVVLFSKNMPSWTPLFIMEFPVVFYALFTVVGGVVGYFWAITETQDPAN